MESKRVVMKAWPLWMRRRLQQHGDPVRGAFELRVEVKMHGSGLSRCLRTSRPQQCRQRALRSDKVHRRGWTGKKLGLLAIEVACKREDGHWIGPALATHMAKFGRRVDDWHVLIWLAVTAFEFFSALNLRPGRPIRLASPGQRGVYQTQSR